MPSCEAQALVGAVVHSLNVKVPSPDAGGAQTSSQLFASRARFLLPLHVEHVAPSSAHVEHRRSVVADAREVARHGTHSRPRTPVPDFQSPQHPVVPRRCPGHEAAQKSLPSAPVWRYFESLHSSAWPVTARWRSTTRTTADAVVFRAIARCMVNAVPGWRGRGERGQSRNVKAWVTVVCMCNVMLRTIYGRSHRIIHPLFSHMPDLRVPAGVCVVCRQRAAAAAVPVWGTYP